jgi:hypothetical protein
MGLSRRTLRKSIFRQQLDFDATVLRAPFCSVVAGNGVEFAKTDHLQPPRVDLAFSLEKIHRSQRAYC